MNLNDYHVCLIDTDTWYHLLPITYTRSVADIRIGLFTIQQKWEKVLNRSVFVQTKDYLQFKYLRPENALSTLFINSAILPNKDLVKEIELLGENGSLYHNDNWIAGKSPEQTLPKKNLANEQIDLLTYPEDIFSLASQEIKNDLKLLEVSTTDQDFLDQNTIIGNNRIYVKNNVSAIGSTFNTEKGEIFIGENTKILPGSYIEGPTIIDNNCTIKSGSKILFGSSIGPWCTIGGEVKNSVLLGYSNKSHDGYLGNSVIGEWCNLGANTNTSNLKNNLNSIKIQHIKSSTKRDSSLIKCGSFLGDHCMTGVNSLFNAGSVVGPMTSVYGAGIHDHYLPAFTWGSSKNYNLHKLDLAIQTANKFRELKGAYLTQDEIAMFRHLYNQL